MLTIPPNPPAREKKPEPPRPAAAPTNVNLLQVNLFASGALLLMFDGIVTVDVANPPTTWSFNGTTSIQEGYTINYGTSVYLLLNGPADFGAPVVIAANDPGARTPDGGYVNAATLVVSDL